MSECRACRSTNINLSSGTLYANNYFTRPWEPHRRRKWGFGIPDSYHSATYDQPNPKSLIHFVWLFLLPLERKYVVQTCPEWLFYAHLRRDSVRTSVAPLRAPRTSTIPSSIDHHRAHLNTLCLLCFDFYYGDMLRWLGGEYTKQMKDWHTDWQALLDARVCPLPDDYPPP